MTLAKRRNLALAKEAIAAARESWFSTWAHAMPVIRAQMDTAVFLAVLTDAAAFDSVPVGRKVRDVSACTRRLTSWNMAC
jgi:hypothetical protein